MEWIDWKLGIFFAESNTEDSTWKTPWFQHKSHTYWRQKDYQARAIMWDTLCTFEGKTDRNTKWMVHYLMYNRIWRQTILEISYSDIFGFAKDTPDSLDIISRMKTSTISYTMTLLLDSKLQIWNETTDWPHDGMCINYLYIYSSDLVWWQIHA